MTELSKSERLILSEILELQNMLDPQAWREVQADALREGYTRFYPSGVANIADEISKTLSTYVYDVLDMYTWLQYVLREPTTGEVPREVQCPGFDGNGSSGAYSYLAFVIEKGGLWADVVFANGKLNSHGFEPNYKQMLDVWRSRDKASLADAFHSEGRDPAHVQFAKKVLAAGRQ